MSDLVFLNGQPVENPHESHEHISPMSTYMAVFGALLVLTVVTYLVSYADLGPGSLPVAMVVAFVKASLVVGYFMHLKYEDRLYAFLLACSLLFVGIFFAITLLDINTTDDINAVQGIRYKREMENNAEALRDGASIWEIEHPVVQHRPEGAGHH